MGRLDVSISVGINFSVCQGDDVFGAGRDAQRATLAPLDIHYDGTYCFTHKLLVFSTI
jgi:hypothetical protein